MGHLNRVRFVRGALGGLAAVVFGMVAMVVGRSAPPSNKSNEFSGKVVAMAPSLEKAGVKTDRDAAGVYVAFLGDDGRNYLIVKESSSRMFFKDPTLLGRPVRLTGKLVGEPPLLQVFTVRTVVNGQLHEPHYWCDICKIKRLEPNDCDCCGAPLEFREEPVNR